MLIKKIIDNIIYYLKTYHNTKYMKKDNYNRIKIEIKI